MEYTSKCPYCDSLFTSEEREPSVCPVCGAKLRDVPERENPMPVATSHPLDSSVSPAVPVQAAFSAPAVPVQTPAPSAVEQQTQAPAGTVSSGSVPAYGEYPVSQISQPQQPIAPYDPLEGVSGAEAPGKDSPNVFLIIAIVIFPWLGIILTLLYKGSYPKRSRAYLITTIISFAFSILGSLFN